MLFCLLAISWAVSGSAPPVHGQSAQVSEYEVKAAFLYNFAKFVEWPSAAFPSNQTPIALCIFGKDPFGRSLDNMVRDKTAGNRQLVIHRSKRIQELKSCQMVFVDSSESQRLSEILESLRGLGVLLVGESQDFAGRGGHIQFTLEDNKVRFSINVDAAERSGLKISSKLLALSKIVHDEPPGRKS